MSYELGEIKLAAYKWRELPNMTRPEKDLWQGLGYAYECYRCGKDREICDGMAQYYVNQFEQRRRETLWA